MGDQILIIDDETDFCFLLKNMLLPKNYTLSFAHTLQEGFNALTDLSPRYIFLDMNLPDGSGLEALSKIKHMKPSSTIIVISAYETNKEDIILKEGADAFIIKPFNSAALYNVLNKLNN
jgi:DNA-binding response OmpR family regulator